MTGDLHDDEGTDALRALYRIEQGDLELVARFGQTMRPTLDAFLGRFYVWLRTQPEYEEFFEDEAAMRRVRSMQMDYWQPFLDGAVDDAYVESRRRVGMTHARIGLPLHTYFAAMNLMMVDMLGEYLPTDVKGEERVAMGHAVVKLLHFDTALVVQAYNKVVNDRVSAQSRSLLEMSTPVTEIWRGILLLPIVGIIDSARAQDVMTGALSAISSARARVFIMDISGVGMVDTAVANHLIKVTRATRLMGCECILSGISPGIAETMVELGIDVGSILTTGTLMQALNVAFDRVGARVVDQAEG